MTAALSVLVPKTTDMLVSLFVGSGAFEYSYAQAHPESKVVCYDIDPAIVNFHQAALSDRLALHDRIMALHATLCKPCESVMRKDAYDKLVRSNLHAGLLGAARFFIVMAYSYSGKRGSFAVQERFRKPSALLQQLPTNIEVRHGDAFDVLDRLRKSRRHDSKTFFYMDPPYFLARKDYYEHASFDHERLATLLHGSGLRWLLSYNDVPGVRHMYAKLPNISLSIAYSTLEHGGQSNTESKAELLVHSMPITAQQRRRCRAAFHTGMTIRFGRVGASGAPQRAGGALRASGPPR